MDNGIHGTVYDQEKFELKNVFKLIIPCERAH